MRSAPAVLLLAIAACSTSAAPPARPSTIAEEEANAASAAELPEAPPAIAATKSEGPYYEPDPGGYASPILRADAPNMGYAKLDRARCDAELARRGIPVTHAAEAVPGVLDPVRLSGSLHGVVIRSGLSPAERAKSTIEIMDCRLVLALDDFTDLLAKRGVVEMIHLSAYRTRKQGGCTPRYDGKQHCAALALDVASFKKSDGTSLVVDRDFKGKIGTRTCTDAVRKAARPPASAELWGFVCDAAERAIFNVILTPNFNKQHKNHFHLEVTPDAAWMLIK